MILDLSIFFDIPMKIPGEYNVFPALLNLFYPIKSLDHREYSWIIKKNSAVINLSVILQH